MSVRDTAGRNSGMVNRWLCRPDRIARGGVAMKISPPLEIPHTGLISKSTRPLTQEQRTALYDVKRNDMNKDRHMIMQACEEITANQGRLEGIDDALLDNLKFSIEVHQREAVSSLHPVFEHLLRPFTGKAF